MCEVYCLLHVHLLNGALTLASCPDIGLQWKKSSLFSFTARMLSFFFSFYACLKAEKRLLPLIWFFTHPSLAKGFNVFYNSHTRGLISYRNSASFSLSLIKFLFCFFLLCSAFEMHLSLIRWSFLFRLLPFPYSVEALPRTFNKICRFF